MMIMMMKKKKTEYKKKRKKKKKKKVVMMMMKKKKKNLNFITHSVILSGFLLFTVAMFYLSFFIFFLSFFLSVLFSFCLRATSRTSCNHSRFHTKPFRSCRNHFRRRSRRSAGDNKILQVCFRLGVKKIRSASRISTGCVSRLVVRTGVFLRRIAGCCSRRSGGEQKPSCSDIGHNVGQFAKLGFLCTEY